MGCDRGRGLRGWARLFRRRITGVMGDVGAGLDGALRSFGYHAVMIACARAHDRSSAVGPIRQ
jgi:hypothetical protein